MDIFKNTKHLVLEISKDLQVHNNIIIPTKGAYDLVDHVFMALSNGDSIAIYRRDLKGVKTKIFVDSDAYELPALEDLKMPSSTLNEKLLACMQAFISVNSPLELEDQNGLVFNVDEAYRELLKRVKGEL